MPNCFCLMITPPDGTTVFYALHPFMWEGIPGVESAPSHPLRALPGSARTRFFMLLEVTKKGQFFGHFSYLNGRKQINGEYIYFSVKTTTYDKKSPFLGIYVIFQKNLFRSRKNGGGDMPPLLAKPHIKHWYNFVAVFCSHNAGSLCTERYIHKYPETTYGVGKLYMREISAMC